MSLKSFLYLFQPRYAVGKDLVASVIESLKKEVNFGDDVKRSIGKIEGK